MVSSLKRFQDLTVGMPLQKVRINFEKVLDKYEEESIFKFCREAYGTRFHFEDDHNYFTIKEYPSIGLDSAGILCGWYEDTFFKSDGGLVIDALDLDHANLFAELRPEPMSFKEKLQLT